MALLKLLAQLGIDKTEFDAGLRDANLTSEKFSKNLAKRIGHGFSIAALLAWNRTVMDNAKSVDELARKLDVTAERAAEIKLAEKLGTRETGKGNLTFSESDLRNIAAANQAWEKLKNTLQVVWAKVAFSPWFGGTAGLLGQAAKATGLVTGGQPEGRPTILGMPEEQFRARVQEWEKINKLNAEADAINERTRFNALTKEEQLNELLKERIKLLDILVGAGPQAAPLMRAEAAKRLAEINAGIEEAGKSESSIPANQATGSLAGVFVGEGGRSIQSGIQATNRKLDEIHRLLSLQGIRVNTR